MRTTGFAAFLVVGLVSMSAAMARQSSQNVPTTTASAPPQTPQSGFVLKVKTRLVTLDVVATDARGKVVTDLEPQELQIVAEHNALQKIANFEFVRGAENASPAEPLAARAEPAPNSFSNQTVFQRLRTLPTVLLLDALNTVPMNQLQARKHMVRLLETLPAGTPVAVFLLSNRLRLVQGFTSDPALLHAAASKLVQANQLDQDPRDDADSALNAIEEAAQDSGAASDPNGQAALADLEDFEKEQVANAIDIRAMTTTAALTGIAHSVAGIPGRKNLIWVSESFPMSIDPDTDNGADVFVGTRDYGDKVQAASNALNDAQVAVYPVDVRGLETQQAFTAAQGTTFSRNSPNQQLNSQLNREANARVQTQATMSTLAENTGGRACTNNNDLSGCLISALNDSSSYYEVTFYPQDIPWDSRFHKIALKTTRRGVKLSYRHGYFALDGDELAKEVKPEDRLAQACADVLPATAIGLVVQPAPAESPAQQGALHYAVSIAPDGLSVSQNGPSRTINVQGAICQFNDKEGALHFNRQDLAGVVPDAVLQSWQTRGLPDSISVEPDSRTRRIRFVVLDVPTGLTGAVDIAVLPGSVAKSTVAPPAAPAKAPNPVLEIFDADAQAPLTRAMASMVFHAPSGQSGTLDWNGDALLYRGDLPVEQSAPAFFNYAFGAKFHCQAGALVPLDAAGGQPRLLLTVRNSDSRFATVDLKGDEPQYSGTLVVDSTARAFFAQVWKLAHCLAE